MGTTSSLIWHCLFDTAAWLLSSLSHCMGGILNLGGMPFDGLLNSSKAGNLGLIGIYQHYFHSIFFMVLLTGLICFSFSFALMIM